MKRMMIRIRGRRIGRWLAGAVGLAGLMVVVGCAQLSAADKARQQAHTTGKYKVRLTTDIEKVTGTCTYVRTIEADMDPVRAPTDSELPDYFREEAVYMGADTVIVKGRSGEAYICGPGPLNPDGTLRMLPPAGTPPSQ